MPSYFYLNFHRWRIVPVFNDVYAALVHVSGHFHTSTPFIFSGVRNKINTVNFPTVQWPSHQNRATHCIKPSLLNFATFKQGLFVQYNQNLRAHCILHITSCVCEKCIYIIPSYIFYSILLFELFVIILNIKVCVHGSLLSELTV